MPTSVQRRLCRPHDCADLASESADWQRDRRRQVGTITTRRRGLPVRRSWVAGRPGAARSNAPAATVDSNSLVHTANQLVMRSVATVVVAPAAGSTSPDARRWASAQQRDCADRRAADSLPHRRSSPQVGTITRSAQSAIAAHRAVANSDRGTRNLDARGTRRGRTHRTGPSSRRPRQPHGWSASLRHRAIVP